jgi:hypothetical protein
MGLCFSVFCVALDNTIIATATPRITDEFHALQDVGWYGSGERITRFQVITGYTRLAMQLHICSPLAVCLMILSSLWDFARLMNHTAYSTSNIFSLLRYSSLSSAPSSAQLPQDQSY